MVDLIMITAPQDQTPSIPTTPPTLPTPLRPLEAAARVPSECAVCGAVGWGSVLQTPRCFGCLLPREDGESLRAHQRADEAAVWKKRAPRATPV